MKIENRKKREKIQKINHKIQLYIDEKKYLKKT